MSDRPEIVLILGVIAWVDHPAHDLEAGGAKLVADLSGVTDVAVRGAVNDLAPRDGELYIVTLDGKTSRRERSPRDCPDPRRRISKPAVRSSSRISVAAPM